MAHRDVTVRRATLADREAIINIRGDVQNGTDYIRYRAEELLTHKDFRSYVITKNDTVIGFRYYHIVDDGQTANTGGHRMTPEAEGKGYFFTPEQERELQHLPDLRRVIYTANVTPEWKRKKEKHKDEIFMRMVTAKCSSTKLERLVSAQEAHGILSSFMNQGRLFPYGYWMQFYEPYQPFHLSNFEYLLGTPDTHAIYITRRPSRPQEVIGVSFIATLTSNEDVPIMHLEFHGYGPGQSQRAMFDDHVANGLRHVCQRFAGRTGRLFVLLHFSHEVDRVAVDEAYRKTGHWKPGPIYHKTEYVVAGHTVKRPKL